MFANAGETGLLDTTQPSSWLQSECNLVYGAEGGFERWIKEGGLHPSGQVAFPPITFHCIFFQIYQKVEYIV